MVFNYATVMTWMKYLHFGYWKLNIEKQYSEDEIISKFNDLFRNELVREGLTNFGINPYKGIGYMTLSFDEKDGNFNVNDKYGYMTCFYLGLNKTFNGKKLALNKKIHGFNSNYFNFVEKEDSTYVFLSSIVSGECKMTPNIRRMINILYLRQQPICESYDHKKVMFFDYSDEERKEIMKECLKY